MSDADYLAALEVELESAGRLLPGGQQRDPSVAKQIKAEIARVKAEIAATKAAEELPPAEHVEALASDLKPEVELEGGGHAGEIDPDTPVEATADEVIPGTETSK